MKIISLITLTSLLSGDSFLLPNNIKYHRTYIANDNVLKNEMDGTHSAAYLNEQRDYWWNNDFLQLMGRRWELGNVDCILDVGCGTGHWGRALSRILPNECKIYGIDMESRWVREAREISVKNKISHKFIYEVSDVYTLPFERESFDVVTCQTLLIHLQDPKRAILEMLRVLKPLGRIIVAEPNNLLNNLFFTNHDLYTMDDKFEIARFQYICEIGKMRSGEGFNSLGEILPGIFNEVGLEDVQVHISDKTLSFIPPYKSREEILAINQIKKWLLEDFWIWSKIDTYRYFLAGGGKEDTFEDLWAKATNLTKRFLNGIQEGTLSTSGGNLIYCISGVKKT